MCPSTSRTDGKNSSSTRGRRTVSSRIPIVGIVGPIGAGKSEVAALFAGWAGSGPVISGDDIGREVIDGSATLRRRLAREFGSDILTKGVIDRRLLASRAFVDGPAIARLNALVHPPLVRLLTRRIREEQGRRRARAVIVDAALLVEWGYDDIGWDVLIGVWAPEAMRVARLEDRGWTRGEMRRRATGQIPWTRKRSLCDCIVANDDTRSALRRRARLCWQKVLPSP